MNSNYRIATDMVISRDTRWFKYDRDYLCVNKSQFVPLIFEPPCISVNNLNKEAADDDDDDDDDKIRDHGDLFVFTQKNNETKVILKEAINNLFHYRPLMVRRLKLQEFLDSRYVKVANCQPKAPAAFIPTRYSYLC
jgi:hypothetical protein